MWKGIAAGLLGGLVATWTMNQFQALLSSASEKDQSDEDKKKSESQGDDATVRAASAVSEEFFDHSLTKREKKLAGQAVHFAFGATVGGAYGLAAELAPPVSAGAGLPFGAALWLAADEIAVPALGLSKPPAEHPLSTHVSALAAHCVYGLTTEIVRRGTRRLLGQA